MNWGGGDDGFYDKKGKWWTSKWEWEQAENKKLEVRARANGLEHVPDPRCECGAKHDRDFPQIHSPWCKVYMGNK